MVVVVVEASEARWVAQAGGAKEEEKEEEEESKEGELEAKEGEPEAKEEEEEEAEVPSSMGASTRFAWALMSRS